MAFTKNDSTWMKRAIQIAQVPRRCLLPNPRVGAVIVQNGKTLGEGFHSGPGFPHAEVEAIRNAERKGFRNFTKAEIFVSLEPCCHIGKRTPPCTPLLIQKKFKRVVVATLDPNPKVSGRGIRALKQAGMRVEVGLLAKEAAQINQDFFKNQLKKTCYITLKIATTFDGKMADDFGRSKWITSEPARAKVQQLRALADAIAVGSKTIDQDNPSLNLRLPKQKATPKKIVIFGTPSKPLKQLKVSKRNGLENIRMISKTTSLRKSIKALYVNGTCHLLLEGGPKLASEFLAQGLVDQLVIFQGKGLLGGQGAYSIGSGWGLKRLEKSIKFEPEIVQKIGPDILIQGLLHVYRANSKSR